MNGIACETHLARFRAALALQRAYAWRDDNDDGHGDMQLVSRLPHAVGWHMPWRREFVLALRGSLTLDDYTLASMTRAVPLRCGASVHCGVWLLGSSLYTQLRPLLRHLIEDGTTVTLCGHSLGGAVAAVLLLYIDRELRQRAGAGRVRLFTFGAMPFVYETSDAIERLRADASDLYSNGDFVAHDTLLLRMADSVSVAVSALLHAIGAHSGGSPTAMQRLAGAWAPPRALVRFGTPLSIGDMAPVPHLGAHALAQHQHDNYVRLCRLTPMHMFETIAARAARAACAETFSFERSPLSGAWVV